MTRRRRSRRWWRRRTASRRPTAPSGGTPNGMRSPDRESRRRCIDVYDRNVDARRQLARDGTRAKDTLPAWRIEPPAPADELLGYYHEAESAIRCRLELPGRDQPDRDPLRQHRRREHRRRARPDAVPAVDVRRLRRGRRYPLAPRQHHGGRPLPGRQRLRQRSRSRHLPVQPRARIRAGGRRLRRGARSRSRCVRRLLPVGRLLLHHRRRRAAARSVTPRRHRSRSATTWRPTRSDSARPVLQQAEQLQVGDVLDDHRRRDVRNVLVRPDLRVLHRRAEPIGRCDRAAASAAPGFW